MIDNRFILLHFEFVDYFGSHEVGVFNHERLMPSALFFVQFDNQVLVIGDSELRQGKYGTFRFPTTYQYQVVVCPKRYDYLFLNSGAFSYFLIDDFERDVIHIKRHIGRIFELQMKIQQSVVRVNSFERVLDAETLLAKMLYFPVIIFVNGLHYQFNQ